MKQFKQINNNKEALIVCAELLKMRAKQILDGSYYKLDKKKKKEFFSKLIDVCLMTEKIMNEEGKSK